MNIVVFSGLITAWFLGVCIGDHLTRDWRRVSFAILATALSGAAAMFAMAHVIAAIWVVTELWPK
jgi:hypothetical protein